MAVQFFQENYKGKDVTIVDVFEAVGKHSSGKILQQNLEN